MLLAFPNFETMHPLYSNTIVLVGYLGANWILGTWSRYSAQPGLLLLEIAVLLISFLILRKLSRLLLNLELGLQIFVLQPGNSPIMSYARSKAEVERELRRAFRFDRRVACIYCEVYDPKDTELRPIRLSEGIKEHIQLKLKHYYERSELGRNIMALAYKSDMLIFYRNGFLLFLPETGKPEVMRFLDELAFLLQSQQQLQFLVGESYFPVNGTHFDELVHVARSNIRVFLGSEKEVAHSREGDVFVDIKQRLEIERQAEWVNKLAYQSPSARIIYRPIKRMMDVLLTLLIAPLLIPIVLVVALLIYLDDRGPIFYYQQRTGYGGRRFKMIKFRTMVVNAPAIPPQVVRTDDGQERYIWPDKVENDPRITRVGRILRKTSLDEFPQFWNVLVGDMSWVGPRPTTWNVDMYTLLQTERLNARPGITGLWQVSARESKNFDERLLWDAKYVEKMSLWLDLQILWRTVAQVINRGGV
jgi:lipopolysaccharide/colanic/teichoic acid biosynthesis glycosyltransferase